MEPVSTYTTTRRVEFSDTDLAGIVHFSKFNLYMESVEHEFLRHIGTSVVTEYNGDRIGWPRMSASCKFKAPAFFQDELTIALRVKRKGNKSLTYAHTITRDNTLIAEGEIGVACVVCNPGEEMRAIPIPPEIGERIGEASEGP
ncbi:MAG: 4-hydroxybenzoyl-CoA thioesterase [Gemmatimonadetes bacterium]|nr:4-hydroxybenzoyl-CoA thioesterase [Gemmatimonadota bacterium]